MRQPLVAVPTDVRLFDNYVWHAVPEPYLAAAVRVAGVLPLGVPSLAQDDLDIDSVLDSVDGVMMTGSKSNVYPELYGGEASEENGPYDHGRDTIAFRLIRGAIERGVPLLTICRGIQELNVALGGTLATEIHEHEDRMDHRAPDSHDQTERFAIRQPVEILEDSSLAEIFGCRDIMVNSLHRQAIDRVADGLNVEAFAPDGTIEAVTVKGARDFAVGVQWHPEYWAESDEFSRRLFMAFGDAVRRHQANRNAARQAAE